MARSQMFEPGEAVRRGSSKLMEKPVMEFLVFVGMFIAFGILANLIGVDSRDGRREWDWP